MGKCAAIPLGRDPIMNTLAATPTPADRAVSSPRDDLPRAKAANLSRDDIEQIADKVRNVVGYQPGDELIPIIKRIGGQVDFINLHEWLDDHCATITVRGKRDFTIQLSRVGGLLRNRFSLAHELGHYVLHSQIGKIPLQATRSLISERVEWEANWFAAAFLMPAAAFRQRWEMTERIEDLASYFLVSTQAVKVRKEVIIDQA